MSDFVAFLAAVPKAEWLKHILNLTLFPVLIRQPRVQNAWVLKHLDKIKNNFANESKAQHFLHYVALPARKHEAGQDTLIERPTPIDLSSVFAKKRPILELIGEGGSGKTTLAMQIAQWAMDGGGPGALPHAATPVIIDEETSDIVGLIRQRIKSWVDEDIEREFLDALLKHKRILVVVDRLSERPMTMQKYIRTIYGSTALGALVITTRFRTNFVGGDLVQLFPQPLNSETLLHFMTGLLQFYPTPQPFPELQDQLDLAKRFTELIRVENTSAQVTPLLVKLYLDKAVRLKQERASLDEMPTSIPEMYFEFLRTVNPQDPEADNYLSDENMFRAAELLGKLAVGLDFVPKEFAQSAARKVLLPELASFKGMDPIKRLVDNNVLKSVPAGSDVLLRFIPDPIAEFLAAMALAKECGTSSDKWEALIREVGKGGQSAVEFGQALRLIWQAYRTSFGWPSMVAGFGALTDQSRAPQSA